MDGVLRAIQEFWTNEVDSRPVEAGTRIDHRVNDELDIMDVWYRLSKDFGFDASQAEWTEFCGLSGARAHDKAEWDAWAEQNFTFGKLTEFVRKRVPADPIEPLNLLGRPCAPAGAFVRVKGIVCQLRQVDSVRSQHADLGGVDAVPAAKSVVSLSAAGARSIPAV